MESTGGTAVKCRSAGRFFVLTEQVLGRTFQDDTWERSVFFVSNRLLPQFRRNSIMSCKGERLYRSYIIHEMCPMTIHCRGVMYKGAILVSAGFRAYYSKPNQVSAYLTMIGGTAEISNELLDFMDQKHVLPFLESRVEVEEDPSFKGDCTRCGIEEDFL